MVYIVILIIAVALFHIFDSLEQNNELEQLKSVKQNPKVKIYKGCWKAKLQRNTEERQQKFKKEKEVYLKQQVINNRVRKGMQKWRV